MLDKICSPISKELQQLEEKFKVIIQSDVKLVNDVFAHIVGSKGKRLRPILLFLSSGLNGKPTEKSIDAALLVELLHTATLIHDDVVDNSDMRRGIPSINQIWENKISVLIGDFIFAHIFKTLVDMQDDEMIRIIANISIQMSQGELLHKAERDERDHILSLLKNEKQEHVSEIKDFVRQKGGIDYAEQKAEYYINKALQKLEIYPTSAYKNSLILLADYITSRDK